MAPTANRSLRPSIGSPVSLFGSHVARRPHDHPRPRQLCRRINGHVESRPRQTEIEQLHTVLGQEHIRRFEIAMHDAAGVERRQRRQDAQRRPAQPRRWWRRRYAGARKEPALQKLHRDEQRPLVLADLVDLADVWMIDAGGRAGLAPEPLLRRRIVGHPGQHLQRDGAMKALVASGIDDAHAAFAELAFDGVGADANRRSHSASRIG